jgi:hypothetical protein
VQVQYLVIYLVCHTGNRSYFGPVPDRPPFFEFSRLTEVLAVESKARIVFARLDLPRTHNKFFIVMIHHRAVAAA